MKRLTAIIVLLAIVLVSAGAVRYESKKKALKEIFKNHSTVMKKDVKLSIEDAADINDKFGGGHRKGEKFSIYYARNDAGEPELYAITMLEILEKYMAYHTWVVVFDSEFTIQKVVMIELTDEYTFGMSSPLFLDQFSGKKAAECVIAESVDAVSGATMSSELFITSLEKAEYIIKGQSF
jgi:hypothetical protein